MQGSYHELLFQLRKTIEASVTDFTQGARRLDDPPLTQTEHQEVADLARKLLSISKSISERARSGV